MSSPLYYASLCAHALMILTSHLYAVLFLFIAEKEIMCVGRHACMCASERMNEQVIE